MAPTAAVIGATAAVASTAKALTTPSNSGAADAAGQQAADLRQQASNLWTNLQLPTQNTTPLQGETWLQNYNPVNYTPYIGTESNVTDNPAMQAAQLQALSQTQALAKGGLQPADLIALQQIQQQQAGAATSQNQAAQDALRSRGEGGAGASYAATLAANQNAANSASTLYQNAATTAMNRQLTAIQAAAAQATTNRGQDDTISAQMAANNNAFNTQVQNLRTAAAQNAAANSNQAQAANLAGQQGVANSNVTTANQNVALQNQLAQNQFGNQTTQISGEANALGQQSTLASANQAALNQQTLGNDQQVTAGLQGIASAAKGFTTPTGTTTASTTPSWFSNILGGSGSPVPQTSEFDGQNVDTSTWGG